jgi:hypothetical protein
MTATLTMPVVAGVLLLAASFGIGLYTYKWIAERSYRQPELCDYCVAEECTHDPITGRCINRDCPCVVRS